MRVEKDMVVNAPVARVYELWTDFENFPRFMSHVEEVRRSGENQLHWKAKVGPRTVEWDAEIKALVPNRTVTWHSTSGSENAGAVTLAEKGHITEMHVVIEYAPNLFERVAEMVTGELHRSVEQDLERFRALAEGRDVEAGQGRSTGAVGSTLEQVGGTLGLGGKGKDEDTASQSDSGSGSSSMSGSTGSSAMSGGTSSTSSTTGGMSSGSMSSGTSGGPSGAAEDLQRDTAVAGMNIEAAPNETAGTNTPSAVERADERGTLYDMSNLDAARRTGGVEVEGLGSDESPGEAVGSTSPEEVAAARAALSGTPGSSAIGEPATSGTGGDTDSPPSDAARSRAESDFMAGAAADEATAEAGSMGAPGNPGDQEGGLRGVQPTRGGLDASAPDAAASPGGAPVVEGALGPSLMTYEAGTGPEIDRPSHSDLGSMADDRTTVGSTTVSTGSMTDTGRARDTSGMAGGAAGYTTESTSSLAGQGDLGGGPDDVGGRAATPDLGHTPQGGGTGRGAGDAYGSSVTQSGGPASSGMPLDVMGAGENPLGSDADSGRTRDTGATDRGDMSIATGNQPRDLRPSPDRDPTDRGDMSIATGNQARDFGGAYDPDANDSGMTEDYRPAADREATDRGDMSIATDNQPRDMSTTDDRGDMSIATGNQPRATSAEDTEPSPVEDASVGGTGATYSGGTGGWGTESPDSSGAAGWTPSSTKPGPTGGNETF